MTRAPQLSSMRSRVAGMLPPGSPATISTRTLLAERSIPSWAATSASLSAYVGVQQRTVALTASIMRSRSWLDIPPPGTQ